MTTPRRARPRCTRPIARPADDPATPCRRLGGRTPLRLDPIFAIIGAIVKLPRLALPILSLAEEPWRRAGSPIARDEMRFLRARSSRGRWKPVPRGRTPPSRRDPERFRRPPAPAVPVTDRQGGGHARANQGRDRSSRAGSGRMRCALGVLFTLAGCLALQGCALLDEETQYEIRPGRPGHAPQTPARNETPAPCRGTPARPSPGPAAPAGPPSQDPNHPGGRGRECAAPLPRSPPPSAAAVARAEVGDVAPVVAPEGGVPRLPARPRRRARRLDRRGAGRTERASHGAPSPRRGRSPRASGSRSPSGRTGRSCCPLVAPIQVGPDDGRGGRGGHPPGLHRG